MTNYPYALDGKILSIKDVHLSFGKKVILRGVNGQIDNIVRPDMQQGQVVALLGPSGIGKTQLFRIIAGLEVPDGTISGSVTIGIEDTPVEPGFVGVVAQNYPLFRNRTVRGNLLVAGKRTKLTKKEVAEKADSLLGEFDLTDRGPLYPKQLSGGQRQRLAIAQQLMCSEHLVLMDEPFSGLDPLMVDRVSGLIQKISTMDEYNTIILVTHDIGSAICNADTIWVMGRDVDENGNIIPGAYIKHTIDLIGEGLAWRPDIRKEERYREIANELRDLFPTL